MTLSNAISSAGSSITSPAKLGFIGYVLLAYSGRIETSRLELLIGVAVFFVLQVFHDDYARILLNKRAERIAEAKEREATSKAD